MEEEHILGGSGIWIFALLILLFGAGGFGGFGGNRGNTATQSDVVYTSAFNQLQDENTAIRSDIQRAIYENASVTKDVAYNNLSNIKDLEASVNLGFANQQKCCCETLRAIDNVNYLNSQNTQKILDYMAQRDNETLRSKIQTLEMQQALCGVIRYPTSTTYTAQNPYFGCGCNGNI